MKLTFGLWFALFVIGWMTAGFFPAIFLTALAAGSSISLGLHAQSNNALGSSSYKSLK